MAKFKLKINGTLKNINADPDTPILWVLRDHLDLVGTKYGCGIAQCGACTVHLNDSAIRSCSIAINALVIKKSLLLKASQNHPKKLKKS